jgi:hypothetical protein
MLGAASGFVASSVSAVTLIGEWNFDSSDLANTGTEAAGHGSTAIGTLAYTDANFSAFNSGKALDISAGSFTVDNTIITDPDYAATYDTDTFTISFWMKATGGANWSTVASNGKFDMTNGARQGWYLRRYAATENLQVGLGNPSVQRDVAGVFVAEPAWHHFVLTRDGAGQTFFYLDGQSTNIGNTVFAAPEDFSLEFGGVTGLIDEIKFYDGALTSEQVTSLRITNVIPEPGSYALLASLASLGFAMARRRI